MLKQLLFTIIFILPVQLWAQSAVSGAVYDFDLKTMPLQDVKVRNISNNQTTKTNAAGKFSVGAEIGDVLEFSSAGRHVDTLYLISLSPKKIYLPVNSTSLKEVAIVGAKINPAVLAADPDVKEFKQVESDGIRGKGNNDRAGGLILNLGYGKYRKQQAKIKELEARERYEAEINSVFTEAYVSSLVKLKGQELKDFMTLYRPPVATVESERPFNYAYYTVQAYHAWLKLPPAQRKPVRVPELKKH